MDFSLLKKLSNSGGIWCLGLFLCLSFCSNAMSAFYSVSHTESRLDKTHEVVYTGDVVFYGRKRGKMIMCRPASFVAFEDMATGSSSPVCFHSSDVRRFPRMSLKDSDIAALAVFTSDTGAESIIPPSKYPVSTYSVFTKGQPEAESLLNKVGDSVTRTLNLFRTQEIRWQPSVVVKMNWNRTLSPQCGKTIPDIAKCPSNAYQVLIAINGEETIAIYNFEKIGWKPEENNELQMGFNAGNDFDWSKFTQPPDLNELLTFGQLPGNSSGRFMYLVSSDPPLRLGCLNAKSGKYPLTIHPMNTTMLGGDVLTIGGPCKSGSAAYKCVFVVSKDVELQEEAIWVDSFYLRCRVPSLMKTGQVLLRLQSTSNSNGATFEAYLDVVRPDQVSPKVRLAEPGSWAGRAFPMTQADILWTPETFKAGPVTLQVFGYSEAVEVPEKERLKVMKSLTIENTGKFTVTDGFRCDDVSLCLHHHMGVLALTGSYDGTINQTIWSRLMPMGWFVNTAMTNSRGDNWADKICESFEPTPTEIQWSKVACPCTLEQAQANVHEFMPTDDCPTLPGGCEHAKPQQSCFQSALPRADGDKHLSALCCYSQNNRLLLHAEDILYDENSNHASRGSFLRPATDIPQFSFFYRETLQFFYCCLWRKNAKFCPYLNARRPTPSCQNYHTGGLSAIMGDPHIISFGNEQYTVNAYGDFILLKSKSIQLHGRFAKTEVTPKATVLTAVAFKVGTTQPISIFHTGGTASAAQAGQQWFRIFNQKGEHIIMDTGEYSSEGVFIRENATQHSLHVLLGFENEDLGFVLRKNQHHAYINIEVSIGSTLQGATVGLLGKWQALANVSSIVPCDNSHFSIQDLSKHDKEISDLTETCRVVAKTEKVFWYRKPWTLEFVNVKNFIPGRVMDVPKDQIPPACSGSKFCAFDHLITDQETVWRNTLEAENRYNENRNGLTKVLSCGRPSVPGGILSSNDYRANSVVEVTSCKFSGALEKKISMTCQELPGGGYGWKPDPSTTDCNYGGDDSGVIAAGTIAWIIIVVIVFILLVFLAVFLLMRYQKRKHDGKLSGKKPKNVPPNSQTDYTIPSRSHAAEPIGDIVRPPQRYRHPVSGDEYACIDKDDRLFPASADDSIKMRPVSLNSKEDGSLLRSSIVDDNNEDPRRPQQPISHQQQQDSPPPKEHPQEQQKPQPSYQQHPPNSQPNYQQRPPSLQPNYQQHPRQPQPNYQQHPRQPQPSYQLQSRQPQPSYQQQPRQPQPNYQQQPRQPHPNHHQQPRQPQPSYQLQPRHPQQNYRQRPQNQPQSRTSMQPTDYHQQQGSLPRTSLPRGSLPRGERMYQKRSDSANRPSQQQHGQEPQYPGTFI